MPVRDLKDGTLKIADNGGTGGANVITVSIEEGNLEWTESDPVNMISDRGTLDHARAAAEEPVEGSFSIMFETFLTEDAPTVYEALTQTGDASSWVSAFSSTDAYGVVLEFSISDPAGAGNSETVTFDPVAVEERSFSEGSPSNELSFSFRGLFTAPSYA